MRPEEEIEIVEPDNGLPEKQADSGEMLDEEEYSIFSLHVLLFFIVVLGVVMTLLTLMATIYFPLIPMLSNQLSVSIQSINLTVTVYVIAQAVSPGVFASLSDSFGRRPVLLGVILIYCSATLGLFVNPGN
ncbi:hypothetical protein F5Y03DRAFT_401392 [Xylaria venustula]|nr:hypothetical protein F5Y03DRAFT_401392 [Xylaria venustula]